MGDQPGLIHQIGHLKIDAEQIIPVQNRLRQRLIRMIGFAFLQFSMPQDGMMERIITEDDHFADIRNRIRMKQSGHLFQRIASLIQLDLRLMGQLLVQAAV